MKKNSYNSPFLCPKNLKSIGIALLFQLATLPEKRDMVARFSGTEKAKLNIKISRKEPNSKLWRGDWGSRLFTPFWLTQSHKE
jgi:hypothetical protein